MSSWKKYLQTVPLNKKISALQGQTPESPAYANKFSSYLPEIYSGSSNRLERYQQYDQMDQDSEINASLDTIADFATSIPENTNLNFEIVFNNENSSTPVEINIIKQALISWCKINKFNSRLWRIFRSTIKYGDQFFLRDPETFELYWIDHYKVQSVIVNPEKGKKPEYYIINDLDINLQTKVATLPRENAVNMINSLYHVNKPQGENAKFSLYYNQATSSSSWIGKFRGVSNTPRNEFAISAEHIVHFSLSEGLDALWPFGSSILESIFKVYKQKELLEDALIIYRVQRAPERRVFYVDVGNMPPHKAISYVERIKNEIHQRRIPNKTGGGTSILDASYNPLCLSLDTNIPILDGKDWKLSEIIEYYKNSNKKEFKNLYTYSLNENTHEIEVAKIVDAKITGNNKKLIRIHLDNGNYVDSTPEHRFITREGKEIRADELCVGMSLMPFYKRLHDLSKNCKTQYLQVLDPKTMEWCFVHRLVHKFYKLNERFYKEKYKNLTKNIVHHIDCNRYNNMPDNLCLMHVKDHWIFHSDLAKREERRKNVSEMNRKRWKNENYKKLIFDKQKIKYSEELFKILIDTFSQENQQKEKIIFLLNGNKKFMEIFKKSNENTKCANKNFNKFNERNLNFLLKINGFDKWKDFRDHYSKIKNIKNSVFYQKIHFNDYIIQRIKQEILNNKKVEDIIKKLNEDMSFIENWKRINYNVHGKAKKLKSFHNFSYKHLRTFVLKLGHTNLDSFRNYYNHKITKIEFLEGGHDVGDIQIESPSGSHWFSVSSGIFVHNSILEDYFFPVTAEGRGSKVETLPAGENLGQIDDLRYFDNKLKRGLRVPSSYLPSGPEDGQTIYNDGKIGTAYIQEYRFSKYLQRLQNLLQPVIDKEFKYFLKKNGINVDISSFSIYFWPPQNFGKYRQLETDSAQIQIFSSVSEIPWLSKRFIAKRYLGLTDDEIMENEKLWLEENPLYDDENKNDSNNFMDEEIQNETSNENEDTLNKFNFMDEDNTETTENNVSDKENIEDLDQDSVKIDFNNLESMEDEDIGIEK